MSATDSEGSAGAYNLGAVKISSGLLQTLSAVIPVPYLTTAMAAATQIADIAEVSANGTKNR